MTNTEGPDCTSWAEAERARDAMLAKVRAEIESVWAERARQAEEYRALATQLKQNASIR